jgi:hypothetical protein
MVRDLTHRWELVKAILEENYATRRTLDYYACKMFSARQGKMESIASWGNKKDEMQTDLREAARRVCKSEEILGAISLIKHLGKACFIQGLSNERIKTIVRSRGESILLSQAIEISLEEESSILSVKEKSPSAANGPPLRCNKCNKLGHTANRCLSTGVPTSNVRLVASCFNCGRDGHIARDCRRRPTSNVGAGRGSGFNASVGRDSGFIGGTGRGTHLSVVGRDTDNRAQGKGWFKSGNGRRELSSKPTAAHRQK